jgi:hypothetical protein
MPRWRTPIRRPDRFGGLARALTLGAAVVFLAALPVTAHPLNAGLADITVSESEIAVRLSVNLFELDLLLSLDRDLDGRIQHAEIESQRRQISNYLATRVQVLVDGKTLPMDAGAFDVRNSDDGKPAFETTLRFRSSMALRGFTIKCEPLTEFGTDHRIIARISRAGGSEQFVFQQGVAYQAGAHSTSAAVVQFVGLGAHHILIGYDHLAFLLALLLASGPWLSVVKIVTAFTLAHSVTLSLAALNVVSLPAWLIEAGIAASVVYVAIENLVSRRPRQRWLVSLGFGLVHGFGFAGVLHEMALPRDHLLAALFFFNLGVEVGQLAVISVLLPLLWLLAHTSAYRATVTSASLGILGVATLWLVRRLL